MKTNGYKTTIYHHLRVLTDLPVTMFNVKIKEAPQGSFL
jgi:hypothetical protein